MMGELVKLGTFKKPLRCLSCGRSLEGRPILAYPHKGGLIVNGTMLWVYVECVCRYQNSYRKLGICVEEAAGMGGEMGV